MKRSGRRTRRRQTRRARRSRQRGGAPQRPNCTRDEFNRLFPEAGLVTLPYNCIALGRSNSQIYSYWEIPHNKRDSHEYQRDLDFFRELAGRIQRPNFYVVQAVWDGFSERMPDPQPPVEFYKAGDTQFKGAHEISEPNPHRYPLLHNKKYVLCFAKRKVDPYSLAIIDPYMINGHTEKFMHEVASVKIPWEQRISRLIWKGTAANGEEGDGRDKNMRHKYIRLVKEGKLPLADYMEKPMSRVDQCKYKYILDINGWTTTWDATPWKLASGSVLLKVDGKWEQWYYPQMKAGVHYVSVKVDLSDLNEKIQWCIDHDEECKKIVAAAGEFARTVLTRENAMKHTVTAIEAVL